MEVIEPEAPEEEVPEKEPVPSLLESPPLKSSLDPEGDLCLQVGESPTTSFIVCSRTLARTSSFWNVLLNGEFKEGKKSCSGDDGSERRTIDLPEDDPRPMALLLNIIHSHFDRVPSYEGAMYIWDLYDISVVTDKYDMVHILRPWAAGWLRSITHTHHLDKRAQLSLREQHCHERLWIYWELGDKANFENVAKFMLLNSSASTEDGNSLRCRGIQEPPDIYEFIEQTRPSIIKELLTALSDIIQGLIQKDGKFERSRWSDESNSPASMLGRGIQSCYSVGLWPLPAPADVQCSVSSLSAKLQTVEDAGGFRNRFSQNHSLHNKVEEILKNIPSLLTKGHKRHLKSQAKKSGV
ncbi:hypothetical protein EV127DRAFT_46697 [Xylaria flabelliformis]|nr:hypothetical protein EV127DRAFT_46697 [Xylaria flabelliformis]